MPTALVSGANRGLGREAARQLAAKGYRVILTARDEEKAKEAAAALAAEGADVRPLALDVSDPDSIDAAAARVAEDPGELDVLVNNAGIGSDFGVAGVEPDFAAIQRALDTNFFGAYRLTIALLPLLRKSGQPADRERVERDGRRERDGRLVARLSRLEGVPQRDDAHPLHRAEGRRLSRQLGLPGFRRNRHGRPDGRAEVRRGRGLGDRLARHAAGRRAHRRLLPGRQTDRLLMAAPTPVRGLFETHLTVADVGRSTGFYRDVVGLPVALDLPERNAAFHWIGAPGRAMLGLWGIGSSVNSMHLHIAFDVALDDLLRAPERLRDAGVTPLSFFGQETTEPDVLAWMPAGAVYFRDPDGHLLEYLTMLDAATAPRSGHPPVLALDRITEPVFPARGRENASIVDMYSQFVPLSRGPAEQGPPGKGNRCESCYSAAARQFLLWRWPHPPRRRPSSATRSSPTVPTPT